MNEAYHLARTMARRIEFRMGNAAAPNSPWGRDELVITGDGAVAYVNQRGENVRRKQTRIEPRAVAELFEAFASSPFPESAGGPFLPGSTLIELVQFDEERIARAVLEYHTALKSAYAPVLTRLIALASELRKT